MILMFLKQSWNTQAGIYSATSLLVHQQEMLLRGLSLLLSLILCAHQGLRQI